MSYLRTCARCRFNGNCGEQDFMRETLRDLNKRHREAAATWDAKPMQVTSALFKCQKRWRGLEPGRRVQVAFRWPDFGRIHPADPGEPGMALERIGGWIASVDTGPAPGKLEIWLDRETAAKKKRRIRLWPMNSENVRIVAGKERRDPAKLRREIEEAAAKYDGRTWEDRSW